MAQVSPVAGPGRGGLQGMAGINQAPGSRSGEAGLGLCGWAGGSSSATSWLPGALQDATPAGLPEDEAQFLPTERGTRREPSVR